MRKINIAGMTADQLTDKVQSMHVKKSEIKGLNKSNINAIKVKLDQRRAKIEVERLIAQGYDLSSQTALLKRISEDYGISVSSRHAANLHDLLSIGHIRTLARTEKRRQYPKKNNIRYITALKETAKFKFREGAEGKKQGINSGQAYDKRPYRKTVPVDVTNIGKSVEKIMSDIDEYSYAKKRARSFMITTLNKIELRASGLAKYVPIKEIPSAAEINALVETSGMGGTVLAALGHLLRTYATSKGEQAADLYDFEVELGDRMNINRINAQKSAISKQQYRNLVAYFFMKVDPIVWEKYRKKYESDGLVEVVIKVLNERSVNKENISEEDSISLVDKIIDGVTNDKHPLEIEDDIELELIKLMREV